MSGWSTPRPVRFTPGKETGYSLYRRLGALQGRSGPARMISLAPRFDPRTALPVPSRNTDRAIAAHSTILITLVFIITLFNNALSSEVAERLQKKRSEPNRCFRQHDVFSALDPCFSALDPCFSALDPCFSALDPCFSALDPCFSR
jgi:hypothetical protein